MKKNLFFENFFYVRIVIFFCKINLKYRWPHLTSYRRGSLSMESWPENRVVNGFTAIWTLGPKIQKALLSRSKLLANFSTDFFPPIYLSIAFIHTPLLPPPLSHWFFPLFLALSRIFPFQFSFSLLHTQEKRK